MVSKKNKIWGSIFVIIGILFILRLLGILYFEITIGLFFAYFWPLFLIIPGVLIHLNYFTDKTKEAGILVPAGIFLTVGFTCQVGMLFSVWDIVWPGFILAVAVGLFEYYLFGGRNKALLVPVVILGVLTAIFLSGNIFTWICKSVFKQILLATVFIVLGVLFFFKKQ